MESTTAGIVLVVVGCVVFVAKLVCLYLWLSRPGPPDEGGF